MKQNSILSSRIIVLAATLFLAVPLSTGTEAPAALEPDVPAVPPVSFFAPAQEAEYASDLDPIAYEGIVLEPRTSVKTVDGEIFDAPACTWQQLDAKGNTARTRSSVRVGVNDFGSLGVGTIARGDVLVDAALGDALVEGTSATVSVAQSAGTAFQMPIGASNENLAVGWWGEGWLIDSAATGTTYHYPSNGPGGAVTRVDDFYVDSSRYVTHRVTVDLGEGGDLLADFEWTLDREDCDLTLRTTIENQGDSTQDVEYKRVVDWDNLDSANANTPAGGFYHAQWSEDGRTATSTRYHTVGKTSVPLYECRTTTLGADLPDTIDLDAWDDRYTTGTGSDFVTGSLSGDGNAAFRFTRSLPVGGVWTTHLRYECDHFVQPIVALDDGELIGIES